jgi:hypothetical protein
MNRRKEQQKGIPGQNTRKKGRKEGREKGE